MSKRSRKDASAADPTKRAAPAMEFTSTPEWDTAVEAFKTEVAAEDANDECHRLVSCAVDSVRQVLGDLEGDHKLTADELAWLVRATTAEGSVDSLDDEDVRGFEMVARVFAVDGSGTVDVKHVYHHRMRPSSTEHRASMAIQINGSGPFKKAWTVSLKNTAKECGGEAVYYEQRKFALTSKSIAAVRKVLFPKPAHAALSAKIGDYDLTLWLLAAAGYHRDEIEHCCDGWDGVMLRRVCRSASAADDADWEPTDFDAEVERQKENNREQRSFGRGDYDDDDGSEDGEGEDGSDDDDGSAVFDAKGRMVPQRRRREW